MIYNGNVLIVDDEPSALKVLSAILKEVQYNVFESKDVDSALKIIRENVIDAVITDLRMPNKDGYQFFELSRKEYPCIPIIFLTAYGTVESAVHLMNDGAFYYFIKPPDYNKLKNVLSAAIEKHRKEREINSLKNKFVNENSSNRILGKSPEINRILETIEEIKDTESSVLISGETGTGKELVALNLHHTSNRQGKPFVAVSCAAMPKELIESELFGYEKGSFTGAISQRIGKFEEASGGTVFLDEIGELELPVQAKLLRVLQERTIERIGSNKKIKVSFRLVSSTNRDLKNEIRKGNFRSDIFYRINVVHIHLPALRERKSDIPFFVDYFTDEFCARERKICKVTEEAMDIFMRYPWPGNVRQLKNVIERAVILSKGRKITLNELAEEFTEYRLNKKGHNSTKSLKELELQAIKDALRDCNGNKSKAARQLCISRKAFYKKLTELGSL